MDLPSVPWRNPKCAPAATVNSCLSNIAQTKYQFPSTRPCVASSTGLPCCRGRQARRKAYGPSIGRTTEQAPERAAQLDASRPPVTPTVDDKYVGRDGRFYVTRARASVRAAPGHKQSAAYVMVLGDSASAFERRPFDASTTSPAAAFFGHSNSGFSLHRRQLAPFASWRVPLCP